MAIYLSISQAADRIGAKPRLLSDLFWQRELDLDRCPLIGRVRAIPVDYLAEIRAVLVAKGKLPQSEVAPS